MMHPIFSNVSRETIERLDTYASLLTRWQKRVNLIGPNTVEDIWTRHFADSLQLAPYIPHSHSIIVDIGSGAGFPGLVLAIAGFGHVHIVESDLKKIAFLKEVARQTDVPVTLHSVRAETLRLPQVDVYTSRACGGLPKLLNMLGPQCQKNTICLFHKGKNYTKELHEVEDWDYDLTVHPSQIAEGSVILQLTHIRRR